MKHFLSLLVTIGMLLGAGSSSGDHLWCLESATCFDMPEAVILEEWDDHGGFLGDGCTYLCADVSAYADDFTLEALPNDCWHELPMDEGVARMCVNVLEIILPKDRLPDEAVLPTITNGLYYFYNEQHYEDDPYEMSGLWDAVSINAEAALVDLDTMTMYFYRMDT